MKLARENLSFVCQSGSAEVIVRMPIVPGVTDGTESLASVAQIMNENTLTVLQLLPWNPHSPHYYKAMGLKYPLRARRVAASKLKTTMRFFSDHGIDASVAHQTPLEKHNGTQDGKSLNQTCGRPP